MNKDYIYKRRLLKLADYLSKLPKEKFDYSHWAGSNWGGKANLSCGTSACALGHSTTIPSFRKLGLRLFRADEYHKPFVSMIGFKPKNSYDFGDYSYQSAQNAGAKVFGLNDQEFRYVFIPNARYDMSGNWPDAPSSEATAKQVAKHIRAFVKAKYK